MIVNSWYFQVQAIRRELRDAGHPTNGRPGVYSTVINLPAIVAGEAVGGVITIDGDSDFAWVSTYHYTQNAVYTPDLGVTGLDGSGDPIRGVLTGLSVTPSGSILPRIFDIQILNLNTSKPYHSPDFIDDMPYGDRYLLAVRDQQFNNQVPDGSEIGDDAAQTLAGGANISVEAGQGEGIWRAAYHDITYLPAGTQIRVTLRRTNANIAWSGAGGSGGSGGVFGPINLRGNLIVFNGVRLYPAGRADVQG